MNRISRATWRWSIIEKKSRAAADDPRVKLQWPRTMHNPAVTGAIVGARNAHPAEGVMRAGELRLADKAVHQIEHFPSTERAA